MLAPFCDSFIVIAHHPARRVSMPAAPPGQGVPHVEDVDADLDEVPVGGDDRLGLDVVQGRRKRREQPTRHAGDDLLGRNADSDAVTGEADRASSGHRPGRVEVCREGPAAGRIAGDVGPAGGGGRAPRHRC